MYTLVYTAKFTISKFTHFMELFIVSWCVDFMQGNFLVEKEKDSIKTNSI